MDGLTERSALFALAMIGVAGAWFFLQSKKQSKVHVLVYHRVEDYFFSDFRDGITRYCRDKDLALNYFSTDIQEGLDDVFAELIQSSDADGFVCRNPKPAVIEALAKKGKPFVAVFSEAQVVRLGVTDLLVLDVNDDSPVQLESGGRVLKVAPDMLLEDLSNFIKKEQIRVDRVILGSASMAHMRDSVAYYTSGALSVRDVVVLRQDGYGEGQAAIMNLMEHFT